MAVPYSTRCTRDEIPLHQICTTHVVCTIQTCPCYCSKYNVRQKWSMPMVSPIDNCKWSSAVSPYISAIKDTFA